MSKRPTSQAGSTLIVVPCYNEATRLPTAKFEEFLRGTAETRFLLVNDGSSDATAEVLDQLAARWSGRVGVLSLEINSGKAEAVRRGILAAVDEPGVTYVGYWDADLATPLTAIPAFVEVLDRRADLDIVLGSRVQLLGRTIDRKPTRHYLGRVFATFASLVLALPVYDTQCGAKLFRVSERTRALFAKPFGSRWIFDVELIARYLLTHGRETGIYELPLDDWRDVGDSKVKATDFVRAVGEMARIHRRYRLPERRRKLFDLAPLPFTLYSSAGAIGTTLHYFVLTGCVELLGCSPTLGAVIGAIGGASVNYWFYYHFTFASVRAHRETLPRFLAVAALGVTITGLILGLGTVRFGLPYIVAQVVATLTVLLLGFVLNRSYTFGAGRT